MAATATYTVEQFLADTRATIKAKGLPSGWRKFASMWNAYWRIRRCCKTTWATLCRIGAHHHWVRRRNGPCAGAWPGQGRQVRAPRSWPVLGGVWPVPALHRHDALETAGQRQGYGARGADRAKAVPLNAGEAAAFAKGDIHSIAYGDDTFFIRVTGGDVEKQNACVLIWTSRRSRWKIGQ